MSEKPKTLALKQQKLAQAIRRFLTSYDNDSDEVATDLFNLIQVGHRVLKPDSGRQEGRDVTCPST